MSTYYVKKTGNDSNAGTSESLAWLTVTKAFQTAVAGDTVYIAPGIYREKPTVSNNGTSGSPIKFIGDPDCVNFTNEKKGIVRITGAGTDEKATVGYIITCSKNYVEFSYLHVDGSTTGYGFYSTTGYSPTFKFCFVQDCYVGSTYFNIEDSTIIGCSYAAAVKGTAKRSLGAGLFFGFRECSTVESCVAIGGSYGFYNNTTTINCLAAFNYTRGISLGTGMIAVNCVVYGANQGYSLGKAYNCSAIRTPTAFVGTMVANNCYYSSVAAVTSGTVTQDSGFSAPVETAHILFNFSNVDFLKMLLPYLMTAVLDKGTSAQGTPPTYDALNLTLQQGNGVTPPIGAFGAHAYTLNFTSYYSTAPSIDFTTGGEKIFKFFAKAGVAFTKNVWTKYTPNGEDENYPQLIARGDYITTQTDTGSTIDTWEQLTVSATPTKDCVIELIIKSRGTSTGDVTKFSDFS